MKPLMILTSMNFVVCCALVLKNRLDSGPDAQPQQGPRPIVWLDPDKEPEDLNLVELLSRPRAELAQMAYELEQQIFQQEKLLRSGDLRFTFLPEDRFPHAWPIWRQARYSAKRDMILPPYLGEDACDAALALHLARFGDAEGARKIVNPNDTKTLAEIDRLAMTRNFPAEWTRYVAMVLHQAHYRLAENSNVGAHRIVALHRQLGKLMDDEVRHSPLGTTLLAHGRTVLHHAVPVWCQGEGQEEYVELASVGLADWANMAVPTLPPAHTPEELAAWLGGRVQGKLLVTSGDPLRACDMLGLPLPLLRSPEQLNDPGAGFQGVAGLFSPAGNLEELLVTYAPQNDIYNPAHLAYWLDEQVAASSPLRVGFRTEVFLTRPSMTVGPIVRFTPKQAESAKTLRASLPALPRSFGIVQLDRTFEHNRRFFDWAQAGTRLTSNDANILKGLQWPFAEQKLSQAAVTRDGKNNLVGDLLVSLDRKAGGHGLIDVAAPFWQKYGSGQIQVTGETSNDGVKLIWKDSATQLTLRLPHNQDPVTVEVRDASGKDAVQRLEAARLRDAEERQARWSEGKVVTRLSRSPIEPFGLGMTRKELQKKLAGRQVLQSETSAGDLLTFPGPIDDDGVEWAMRQSLVRFDESGRLLEVRLRLLEIPGKKPGTAQNALMKMLRDQGGAPELLTEPDNSPTADAKNPAKVWRWLDDATLIQVRNDGNGIEVILKDCPLEHPLGWPLPTANWLPRGPGPECLLGTSKVDLYALWKIKTPTMAADAMVLHPAADSPYDLYLVWMNGERVTRIAARHRQTADAPVNAAEAGKAVKIAWGQYAQVFGWPWQQTKTRQGHVHSWSSHDESTQVRIFWQQAEGGPRIFTEWK